MTTVLTFNGIMEVVTIIMRLTEISETATNIRK